MLPLSKSSSEQFVSVELVLYPMYAYLSHVRGFLFLYGTAFGSHSGWKLSDGS